MHFDESLIQRPRVVVAEVGCGNGHPVCVYHDEVLQELSACRMADRVQRIHDWVGCAGRTAPDLYAVDDVTGGKRTLACDRVDVGKCCACALLGGGARVLVTEDGALIRTRQADLGAVRSGSAPSWEQEYDSVEPRMVSRKAVPDMLDLRHGPLRWRIGIEQFVGWAMVHLLLPP